MRSLFLLLLFCLVLLTALPARAADSYVAYPLLPESYRSITVLDRHGRFAGRLLPEQRYWTPLERIPGFLQEALIAIEDSRFYEHGGVDLRGIARALVKDVLQGRLAEGGSTITQQLVKNKHLSAEKTLDRKVQEGLLALEYERKYTKRQILEMYFNEIYFGNGAWGIAQAARLYYDKNPEELSDAECAVLAGVPKNPGRYNPRGAPPEVQQRRNTILARMSELQLLTPRREQELRLRLPAAIPAGQGGQYLAQVRRRLEEWFGPQVVLNGGLEVTAAFDLDLQLLAEKTLKEGVTKIDPALQGALLCLDPATGDILAMAGAVDPARSSYNRALFAQRQPGSTIKPLLYAAALEAGATVSSRWDDEPVSYPKGNGTNWTPRNYGGTLYGELTLRQALAQSNNVIAVKLLDALGVGRFVAFAQSLGLPVHAPGDLSLALGTDEVTLRDLVRAYAPLANGGLLPETRLILRVHDRQTGGWSEIPAGLTPVLSPQAAFITSDLLRDVLDYGTAKGLRPFARQYPVAGKTGTTDDYRDAWFIGYTPQLVAGVWVGHDQPRPGGRSFTGGAVAAPVWERFMRRALDVVPPVPAAVPAGVVEVYVDVKTGHRAREECPDWREEYFIAGSEPESDCPEHGGAPIVVPAAAAPADDLPSPLQQTYPGMPESQPQ